MNLLLKIKLCLLVLFSLSKQSLAQTTSSIGLIGDYTTMPQRENYSLGASVEYFVSDNISLNYNFRIGQTKFRNYLNSDSVYINGNGFNYKITGGALVGSLGLLLAAKVSSPSGNGVGKYLAALSIILVAIPEGATAYFGDADGKYQLGVYCNPLSVDSWNRRAQNHREMRLTMETGIRGNYKIADEWSVRPYIGLKMQYRKAQLGLNSGVALCYNFE